MQNSKGFTLIEFMIMAAIIGILCSIAIPAYQDRNRVPDFRDVTVVVDRKIDTCATNRRGYQICDYMAVTDQGLFNIPAKNLHSYIEEGKKYVLTFDANENELYPSIINIKPVMNNEQSNFTW